MSAQKRRNIDPSKDGQGHEADDFAPEADLASFRLFDLPAPAPDLTRKVMGRLGYMQVNRKVAMRDRLGAWSRRAGVAIAALLAIGIGLHVHDQSSQARRPLNNSVPASLGRDLQHQQQRFYDVIQTIRTFTPKLQAPAPAPAEWRLDDDEPVPVEDDVLRASNLPLRWV